MKSGLCIFLVVIMAMSLAACGAPAAQEVVSLTPAVTPASDVVEFTDPVLEAKVRDAMGKPEGDITVSEAEAVTELLLGNESPEGLTEEEIITNLSGLECFTGVTNLELTFNGLVSISPLFGMTGLKRLCLGNNLVSNLSPISGLDLEELQVWGNDYLTDISPLSGMTHLQVLMIGGCKVTDISAVAGMKELSILDMVNCKVSDISALEGLPLQKLYLSGNPIEDYTSIGDIYNSLEEKDFTAPFTLRDLGFTLIDNGARAGYKTEEMIVTVNHLEWGIPEMDLEANCVKMYLQIDNGSDLSVIYYPDNDVYVFQMSKNNEMIMNYIYDPANGGFTFGSGDRESAELDVRAALGETDTDDILLAPIQVLNDTIQNTFGITADALYAMPFEPPTLLNLGFVVDRDNAVCVYEQHAENYINIEVHRPEWGEKEYDIRFFTTVKNYGLIVTYDKDKQSFHAAAGDLEDEASYACFDFFLHDDSKIDTEVSEGMTVEEYYKNMYNDPSITDIYAYSVRLPEQYISDTFGMSIDELYALPVGE